ncbi:hypothetical protein PZH42_28950, partial [Bacteroides cellulosilyticus]
MSACQLVETASRDFVIGLGYKIVNFNIFSARNVKDSKNRVSHDLALRADISFRNQSALCRDIQQGFAQAILFPDGDRDKKGKVLSLEGENIR